MKALHILTSILLLVPAVAVADIAVVVTPQNPLTSMSKEEVTDLFLGRYSAFSTGELAMPVDQLAGSAIRDIFHNEVVGRTITQTNAHWAKLIFNGRATPPKIASNVATTKRMLAENKSIITYVNKKEINPKIKAVLTTPSKKI